MRSNVYLANSLAAVVSELDLYRLLTFCVPNLVSLFHCVGHISSLVGGTLFYKTAYSDAYKTYYTIAVHTTVFM